MTSNRTFTGGRWSTPVVASLLAAVLAAPPVLAAPCEKCDWAALSRYRADNAKLAADSSRVVFMGDSITELWAREPFLADPHLIGRGISGQTAPQMLVRFRADVIALKPNVVHIMAGTNDVAENQGPETDEEIEGALQSMVELARANGIAVVLATIPPAADFRWHPGLHPTPRIRELNTWIEAYARGAGIGFVDYWSVLATEDGAMKPEYSGDGVHPNSSAYRAMEPLARAAIERELQQR